MNTEAQAAPETGAASDDVHADVRAAMEQLASPEAAQSDAVVAETEAEKADRVRNERGQFTKANEVATGDPAKTVSDADPAQDKIVQPSTAAEPPTSWSADAKAEWSKMSPAIQQAVLKRESEINEGGQRWSEEKRHYEGILAPVRAVAQRNGVDEKEGLNRLLAANDYLERDPENAIRWLAQSYGVDLSKEPSNQNHQPMADPMVAQLHQKVSSLESTLAERQQAETLATIQAFATAPGHEHFEAVKVKMGHLMASGQASDLQDAYDQAVWATSSVREKLLAAQTAEVDANRKAKETAERARRGAISVAGSPSAGAVPQPKREYETVEDAARAAWAQHAG